MNLPSWPFYDDDQIRACTETLRSGSVNAWTGDNVDLFQSDFSSFIGTKYSIAIANGSLALSSAYRALGIGAGDEVITTPRTFIATSSELVLLGAIPIFADVDIQSGCITAETIEPLITNRTRAISVVHLGGWPADMPTIMSLAKSYNLPVVEDCAQAHGASINGQSVGSFGDVSAWSFCQDKIMSTCGEGGMVCTSSDSLWDSMWSFKDHGKSQSSVFRTNHPPGYRWLHDYFGTNFRLTDMQAAVGRIQLSLLNSWIQLRTRNASILAEAISSLACVRVPLPPSNVVHAWYKFYAYVQPEALAEGWSRDRIIQEIIDLGYPAFSGSCSEIYREKCFVNSGMFPVKPLANAYLLGSTSLMFLVHPTISDHQMNNYASVVRSVLLRALK